MDKPYFISFIEEAIMSPKHKEYIAGRIEVWEESQPYDIEEIRFFTKKLDEYFEFRDKWDFKDVRKKGLDEIRRIATEDFYEEIKP